MLLRFFFNVLSQYEVAEKMTRHSKCHCLSDTRRLASLRVASWNFRVVNCGKLINSWLQPNCWQIDGRFVVKDDSLAVDKELIELLTGIRVIRVREIAPAP